MITEPCVQDIKISADSSSSRIILDCEEMFNYSRQLYIEKKVVPELEHAISAFHIPTNNLDLTLWHAVMVWSDLLPPFKLGQLLTELFFPRWLQVLQNWLNCEPDFSEVSLWYSEWKASFPPSVLFCQEVADTLGRALEMINLIEESGNDLSGENLVDFDESDDESEWTRAEDGTNFVHTESFPYHGSGNNPEIKPSFKHCES